MKRSPRSLVLQVCWLAVPTLGVPEKLLMASLLFFPYYEPRGISAVWRVISILAVLFLRFFVGAIAVGLSSSPSLFRDSGGNLLRSAWLVMPPVLQTLCFPISNAVSYWAKKRQCMKRSMSRRALALRVAFSVRRYRKHVNFSW